MKKDFNKIKLWLFLPIVLLGLPAFGQEAETVNTNHSNYLSDLRTELQKEWPDN